MLFPSILEMTVFRVDPRVHEAADNHEGRGEVQHGQGVPDACAEQACSRLLKTNCEEFPIPGANPTIAFEILPNNK
jgi:hypothetical protein